MPITATQRGPGIHRFTGFAAPTSNTTYTPNQFFDVCLPHYSRGVVRLVAYMIRKTLGWCDEQGNPQQEAIRFSYSELEKYAGVSHSMIRKALEEAVSGRFIRCVQPGKAKSRSESGNSATYELSWDEGGQYIKHPAQFQGFFAGEGNRTYIPNEYFDKLITNESLGLIQVVGTVIRFSIGFSNKFGHRRQRVALAYTDIQRYSKISSPRIVASAIKQAIAQNYIERVEQGYFDPNGGMLSRSAHYAVKWADRSHDPAITPKSEAVKNHSEKYSGIDPKSEAADHSEKYSGIQIKQINKTLKQKQELSPEAAASFEKLKEAGFDDAAAETIARQHPFHRVIRQIEWIDGRKVRKNRLGMLRRAIEQDWARPESPSSRLAGMEPGSTELGGLEHAVRKIERGWLDSTSS